MGVVNLFSMPPKLTQKLLVLLAILRKNVMNLISKFSFGEEMVFFGNLYGI